MLDACSCGHARRHAERCFRGTAAREFIPVVGPLRLIAGASRCHDGSHRSTATHDTLSSLDRNSSCRGLAVAVTHRDVMEPPTWRRGGMKGLGAPGRRRRGGPGGPARWACWRCDGRPTSAAAPPSAHSRSRAPRKTAHPAPPPSHESAQATHRTMRRKECGSCLSSIVKRPSTSESENTK